MNVLTRAESIEETTDIIRTYRQDHLAYLRGLARSRDAQLLPPGVEVLEGAIVVDGQVAAHLLPVTHRLFYFLDDLTERTGQRDTHIVALVARGVDPQDLNVLINAVPEDFNRMFWTLDLQRKAIQESWFGFLLEDPVDEDALTDDVLFDIWLSVQELNDETDAALVRHVFADMSLEGREVLMAYACELPVDGMYGFTLEDPTPEAVAVGIRDGTIREEGDSIEKEEP
ncbi:hypothetical protein [Sulfidibacter corallicola]|uniref:Uncharacterized protein n=1 Tax=Sulfidibacter corallicola TaxID=2818388 RepID=A0A8A4TSW4_SULCO|nr:hypothetical protein [Sulfidibacter corallicola]QTD49635.1 hypothetical protein J3U87_28955 [Sulfidibacter corallicola]